MSDTSNVILLVDLSSVLRRRWEATKSEFSTFAAVVSQVDGWAERYKAVIVCADSPNNWRKDYCESYKAQRRKVLDAFLLLVHDVKEKLSSLGHPVVECDGFEADDVIAALVSQSFIDEIHVKSEDKDLAQLVNGTVTQLTGYGDLTPDSVVRKFGVPPSKIRDLLALAGDTADNVQGCPGVGVGKAARLLCEFGDIAGIQRAPDAIALMRGFSAGAAEKISQWDPVEAVTLVSLRTEVPCSLGNEVEKSMNVKKESDSQ